MTTISTPMDPQRIVSSRWTIGLGFGNFALLLLAVIFPTEALEYGVYLILFFNLTMIAGAMESPRDLLCPLYSVLALFAMYSCSAAGSIVFNSPGAFSDETMRLYYIATLAGIVGLVAGYKYVSRKRRLTNWVASSFDVDSRRFGLVLFMLSAVLTPIQLLSSSSYKIQAYTEWATESRLDVRNNAWGGVDSYFSGLIYNILFAAVLFWGMRSKSRALKFGSAALLAVYLCVTVMMGHKGELLYTAFFFLLYIHYRRRPIRVRYLILPTVIIYVFAVMISNVRFTTSIPEMISVGSAMIRDDPRVLLPINAGELNGPPVTLMRIIESKQTGEFTFSLGKTYLTELEVWIPRAVFPGRPLPLSEEFMRIFFPDEYAQGKGHGFFIPTEGYWAFGMAGVVFQMFLFGASIAFLYGVFRANAENDVILFIYSLAAFSLVFTGIRTGFFSIIRNTAMVIAPFLILLPFCLRRRSL